MSNRIADSEMERAILTAKVPLRRTAPARIVRDVLILGFDTEWDETVPERPLLSAQFAVEKGSEVVSSMYDPPSPRLSDRDLLGLIRRFTDDQKLALPIRKNRRLRECHIVLLAHYAAAELGMLDDPFKNVIILPVGQKGHHALIPPIEVDGIVFKIKIVDTFAFFDCSLDELGRSVGLHKIDVGEKAQLARLKRDNPDLFSAYARRDAEIVVKVFGEHRTFVQERWGVDVLSKKTLPATASEVFERHYLSSPPAQYRMANVASRYRQRSGTWSERIQQMPLYDGDVDVRIAAAKSYHGGRAEAFIHGLKTGSFVEKDVVSLFPTAAQLQPLPNEKTTWMKETRSLPADISGLEGFGEVIFRFPPDVSYPCLPVDDVESERLLFPRIGRSHCTLAEMREAISMGAKVTPVNIFFFEPGESEREHDIGRYMNEMLAEKAKHPKGTAGYQTAKLFANALVGKLAERVRANHIIAFERTVRQHGWPAGASRQIARAPLLRDSLRGLTKVGALFMPEQATLILGRARALMAEFVSMGAYLVSTDSVVIETGVSMASPSLESLRSMGSDLRDELEADAILIVRTRFYFLLQRADNIRLPPGKSPLAIDDDWAVVKVARHGLPVLKEPLAEAVLASLREKRLIDVCLPRKQLLSAVQAIREGRELNASLSSERKPKIEWDRKRILLNPNVNPWRSFSASRPAQSAPRLAAARQQKLLVNTNRRRERRFRSRAKRDEILRHLASGTPIREVARLTGVPRSTIQDLKRSFRWREMESFLNHQGIAVPAEPQADDAFLAGESSKRAAPGDDKS